MLALVGTAVLAYRITRSLRRLSAATDGGGRRLLPRADPGRGARRDRRLARSFNAMAAQLRRIDETKRSFYATLSHELRSPLTSVREAATCCATACPARSIPSRRDW